MEKLILSKTNNHGMPPCGKTDCSHCHDKTDLGREPLAGKVVDAANIFRLYYETLLQGFSMDFRRDYGNLHCT
jgi:hypothetical protein